LKPIAKEHLTLDTLMKILKKAVEIEEDSFRLYTMAERKAKLASSKIFLRELAATELEHKKKLARIMKNKSEIADLGSHRGNLEDLGIVDYLVDIKKLSEDAGYQEILIYAAQREKGTHDYYVSLARNFQGSEVSELFLRLADEELQHKIKLEKEYDDTLKDN
jgi:rubrerythrin